MKNQINLSNVKNILIESMPEVSISEREEVFNKIEKAFLDEIASKSIVYDPGVCLDTHSPLTQALIHSFDNLSESDQLKVIRIVLTARESAIEENNNKKVLKEKQETEEKPDSVARESFRLKAFIIKFYTVASCIGVGIYLFVYLYISLKTGKLPDTSILTSTINAISSALELFKTIISPGS